MAISPYLKNNKLLNAWPRVMQESIGTFNQIAGKGMPLNANCSVYIQPTEREPIARALNASYNKIARLLAYAPRPDWFSDTFTFGNGIPTRAEYFQTKSVENGGSWMLQTFGKRATTLLQAAAPITYSDVGGYGVNNTATITVPAGALTNTDEIQIFFQVSDGAPGVADERYQIEPAIVTLTGGNFVITADRSLFIKPSVWATPYKVSDPNNQDINAADNANASTDFITAVDVYRVYNDTTTQLEVLDWNNAVIGTFNGVIVEDGQLGLFGFERSCWNDLLGCCCNRPVRLRVNYYAGLPLVNGYMDAEIEDAIVRLANVLMPTALCPFCEATKNRWEQDRNPSVRDRIAIITQQAAQNAFGYTSYGAIYAYQTAVDMRITSGGSITTHLR